MKISQRLIVDLINNKNFDKKSLGGPKLDNLERFWEYSDSLYTYQKYLKDHGKPPYEENKVLWYVRPGLFEPGDEAAIEEFED